MVTVREWIRRLVGTFRRTPLDRDLEAELQSHLELSAEDAQRRGVSREEAVRLTRIQAGGVAQAMEALREQRGLPVVEAFVQDLRFSWRLLYKDRWFTATVVLVLGLGLGVNNTFFTMVYAICVRGLTLPGIERVLGVGSLDPRGRTLGVSYADFTDVRQAAPRSLEGLAAYAAAPLPIGDEGRAPDRVLGTYISADGFRLVRQAPLMGRAFVPADDRPGSTPVVILGYGVWQTRYAGDSDVVGRTVILNGVRSTVIGVMPRGFGFPNDADLWLPLGTMPGLATQPRALRSLTAFARLADGATLREAALEMGAIASHLGHDYPEADGGVQITVAPINKRYTARIADPTWIQFIVAGVLVLFVACANVASLLLMRAVRRGREMALRASLGATRWRIVRQLMVESACLAAVGGVVGLGLSIVGLRLISRDNSLPSWMALTMDARVFIVLAGICVGTVFVFGLIPALHASRINLQAGVKEGERDTGGRRARRWTAIFLTTEVGMTMVLVVGLAVGLRSIHVAARAQVPIETEHLLTTWLTFPNQTYPTAGTRTAFLERLTDRLRAIPSASAFGIATALPFTDAATRPLTIEGRPLPVGEAPQTVSMVAISSTYFEALGIKPLQGRAFDSLDRTPGHETVIVNERLADMFFPHESALGRHIRVDENRAANASPWLTIVGISPNVRQRPAGLLPDPVVYVPLEAAPPASVAVLVRASSTPAGVVTPLRDVVQMLDGTLPLYRTKTMDDVIRQSLWNMRMSQNILTAIAVIGLLLSAAGLYAVAAHGVAERRREIGLRMALGAQRTRVVWFVLRSALWQLGAGIALGIVGSVVWAHPWIPRNPEAQLQPGPIDPVILIPVVFVLLVVALVACYVPARRATKVDPIVALRCE